MFRNESVEEVNKYGKEMLNVAIFCELLVMISYDKWYLAYPIIILQVASLVYFLVKKNYVKCCCYYIVYIVTSIEEPSYYGIEEVYTLKTVRILGLNIGTIFSFIIFVLLFLIYQRSKSQGYAIVNFPVCRKIYNLFLYLSFSSLLIGFFNFLINDNNISSYSGANYEFFMQCYGQISLVLVPACIMYYLVALNPSCIGIVKKTLYYSLIALAIGQITCFVFGIRGSYLWDGILIVSMVYRYNSFLILEGILRKDNKCFIYVSIGIIGLIFSVIYPTGSGQIFATVSVVLFILFTLLKKKDIPKLMLMTIGVGVGGIAMVTYINQSGSQTLQFKFLQLTRVLEFWKSGWYGNIPSSAKERFDEIINIWIEYTHQPYNFIFGKGLMGSAHDWGHYYYFQGAHLLDAFNDFQMDTGLYYVMHSTLNNLFLSNGLIGVVIFIYILCICLKYLRKSSLLGIAAVWFFFTYRYMTAISIFGMACLIIGIAEAESKKEYLNLHS